MGIFSSQVNIYQHYNVTIKFRGMVAGGQPKNSSAIKEMYLRRIGMEAEDIIRNELIRIILEEAPDKAVEVTPEQLAAMPLDDLGSFVDKVAARQVNGFKSDENGLYLESYQVKAMIRENCNISFAGEEWGRTRKGAKNFLAERLFIEPERIYLGRKEADGLHTQRGVVSGQGSKRSIVTQAEYVDQATISFILKVATDSISKDKDKGETIVDRLPEIFERAQDNGLGAKRSSGFGTFDVIAFEPIHNSKIATAHNVNARHETKRPNGTRHATIE